MRESGFCSDDQHLKMPSAMAMANCKCLDILCESALRNVNYIAKLDPLSFLECDLLSIYVRDES